MSAYNRIAKARIDVDNGLDLCSNYLGDGNVVAAIRKLKGVVTKLFL